MRLMCNKKKYSMRLQRAQHYSTRVVVSWGSHGKNVDEKHKKHGCVYDDFSLPGQIAIQELSRQACPTDTPK